MRITDESSGTKDGRTDGRARPITPQGGINAAVQRGGMIREDLERDDADP